MENLALSTLNEILVARGYKADKFEPVSGALSETKMYTFESVLIIFSNKTRVSEKEFNNFITFASENDHTGDILIVTPTRPSEMVLKLLCNHVANKENQQVQIFELRHLQFDISKHRKVPKHRIISDKEITEMFKQYNIKTPSPLPKIWCQDPMAKWIGARPGDILEVEGMCQSSGMYKHYRYCLADLTNDG